MCKEVHVRATNVNKEVIENTFDKLVELEKAASSE